MNEKKQRCCHATHYSVKSPDPYPYNFHWFFASPATNLGRSFQLAGYTEYSGSPTHVNGKITFPKGQDFGGGGGGSREGI